MNGLIKLEDTRYIDSVRIHNELLLHNFYKALDVDEETIRTYKKGVNNFRTWIKKYSKTLITKQTLIEYKHYLEANYKNTTASVYFTGVRVFFNFLTELGYPNLTLNIKGVKVEKAFRKQALTKNQALLLQDTYTNKEVSTLLDKRNYLIFSLMLRNGLRVSELVRANISDLKTINGKTILYIQGKGKKDKTQPAVIEESAYIPLISYLNARKGDNFEPLFISLATNHYGSRLTARSISREMKKLFIANGLESDDITAHSLRHTAITFDILGGATLQEAQALARHSDINTTLVYSHNMDRIKNAPEQYIEQFLKEREENIENGKDNNNM